MKITPARARRQDCAPPPPRRARLEIDALTSNFPKDEPCTPRTVPHRANPFVRFESHLHLFFGSGQRRFNKTNKTANSAATRPTTAAPSASNNNTIKKNKQRPHPAHPAATNRRKFQTSGIAGDKGNCRGFKQTTGRGSARPQERKAQP